MDLQTAVPFDAQGFLTQIQQGATVNEAEGWVQNLDQTAIQQALTDYQTQIKTYIDSQNPNATVGDVLGTQKIVLQDPAVMAGGLPYKTIATGGKTAALSDSLRHKLRINLYASAMDQALDSPMLSYSAGLPSLAGKRLSFSYPAATAADQAVIDDALSNYQTSLTAYLIHVTPQLKLEDTVVASGGAVTMADQHILTVTVSAPWFEHPKNYAVKAGDFHVIGLNPSGITATQFDARIQQHDLSNAPDLGSTAYTEEMFHQIALGWWAEKYAYNDVIGTSNGVVHYQLPSHTLAGSPVKASYFYGIARSASYASRIMDAKEDLLMAAHVGGDNAQRRNFLLAAGQVGSYLEAGIYDQAFLMEPGHSMSTVTALKAANERGIPIYTIDSGNAAALNQIQTAPEDLQDMADAVAAGLRVTTAKQDITVDNFTGLGYIVEDPQTGAAAYIISGGRNGGDSPAGESVYPLPQFPATPVIGIAMGAVLNKAGAKFVATDGVVTGIMLPAVAAGGTAAGAAAGRAAAILMAIIVTLIISGAVIQHVDTKYPRTNRRYRHYTNAVGAILESFVIVQTVGGTFGDGVYVADADAEEARGAGCPPNSLDVVLRFQIPEPGKENPDKVTGYIEITVTRDNYYKIDAYVNKVGQQEYVISEPLMPALHPKTLAFTRGLYIGPGQFGLEVTDLCESKP